MTAVQTLLPGDFGFARGLSQPVTLWTIVLYAYAPQLQQMQITTCVAAGQLATDMAQTLTISWDVDVYALGFVPTAVGKETEITIMHGH